MPYNATVFKVMIASPSDVQEERKIIREAIHSWNALHSEDRRTVLLPIGWESHSTPEMGERPQGIINKQILKGCDLLIAAFWTRLGSPTGRALSGTVEEIEEHLAAGKPAMLYFSDAPVRLDTVKAEQYEALQAFKKTCMERGLIDTYEGIHDFREKLGRNLHQRVIRSFTPNEGVAEMVGKGRGILDLSRKMHPLSNKARELLGEAVKDRNGMVLFREFIGGTSLSTNDKEFLMDSSPRLVAEWRSVLGELCRLSFLADRDQGSVFEVTADGYVAADALA